MDQPSDDKNVRHILHEHRESVVARVEELRAQMALIRDRLTQKETELIKIDRALVAIGDTETAAKVLSPQAPTEDPSREEAFQLLAFTIRNEAREALKIKELLVLTFVEHFQQGASPAELRDKMKVAYGRDIDPGSIRPILARLREDGVVMRSIPPKWILDPAAAAFIVPELEFWNSPLIKAAQELAWRDDGQTSAAAAERLEEIRLHRVATSDAAGKEIGPQSAWNAPWSKTAVDDR
jgi:hypothetical protein